MGRKSLKGRLSSTSISLLHITAMGSDTEEKQELHPQITICDLTGVGVQDTMIAVKLYDIAEEKDLGIKI